jgi:hypothetical protein
VQPFPGAGEHRVIADQTRLWRYEAVFTDSVGDQITESDLA